MKGRRRAPEDYPHGPAAALVAHGAVEALDEPRAVVLVEGVSDRIAVESVAAHRGVDLAGLRVAVVATGGVHGLKRMLHEVKAAFPQSALCGLYDLGEQSVVERALVDEWMLRPGADPEGAGFYAAADDLEHELIRACGLPAAMAALESEGDLAGFRRMQQQPQWRGHDTAEQLHRWLAGGAERKLRYARILVQRTPADRLPGPLVAVVDRAATRARR